MPEQLTIPVDDRQVELKGTLDRVIFHNNDNGFTVFLLRPSGRDDVDAVTVVGPMANPQPGESLLVRGRWTNNARYGRQLQLASYESVLPATEEGICAYLASGLIKGVGPRLAERIVKKFGADTLRIFDEEPERLLEVSGVGKNKLADIVECWKEHSGVRSLVQFLQPHGISASYAVRIYKHYREDALTVVRENPYRLAMDIRGVGFLTADSLAAKLGFDANHPLRVQAGILYMLLKITEDGHVYYPRELLVQKTSNDLRIEPGLVDKAIDSLALDDRLVLEDLDGETGVFLSRYQHYESKIAFYLYRLLATPSVVAFRDLDALMAKVVSRLGMELAEGQMEAVRTATRSKVMILTGGPGTGKTTIVNAIIQVFEENRVKILLAAPTGRAAKRLAEACGREAKTIHRLLEYNPQEDNFGRSEDNPLACGLLVVDEASMMDTMLAYHLLKAAPLGATIIFVGDVNQLPSVGPGNVLGDLIASGSIPVVTLTEVFRQAAESSIVCSAHLINRGEMPLLESSRDRLSDFYFIRQNDPERIADIIVEMVKTHIPRRFRLDPVNDIQVLSPMHKGVVGTAELNRRLQLALNPGGHGPQLQRGERTWRRGDKVMQIRNNYEKDIYNGDIGHIDSVDAEDKLIFVDYDGRTVVYEADSLDEIVPAYAISIHKSQGSEYPAVVIPVTMQHYMLLQRNLIYTGVTRGKKLVVLVGEYRALAMAIKNNKMQKRFTWLGHRLGQPENL